MPLILILALLVGGSASFAAEQSLPGNPLYPIKVDVNEEVRGWLAFTPQAKAAWENRRAERRLEEAEELATEGHLDADTHATVEENFDAHAGRVADRIQTFTDKENFKAAAEVSANFETSLEAHTRILAKLREHAKTGKKELDLLQEGVEIEKDIATHNREEAEAKISAQASVAVKIAAEEKMREAERKIAQVRAFITAVKPSLDTDAAAKAEARIAFAQQLFVDGKAKFDAGAYGEAFALFQKAQRVAQEGMMFIKARKHLHIDISLNNVGHAESADDGILDETSEKDHKPGKQEFETNTELDSKEQAEASSSVESGTHLDLKTEDGDVKGEEKSELQLKLGL